MGSVELEFGELVLEDGTTITGITRSDLAVGISADVVSSLIEIANGNPTLWNALADLIESVAFLLSTHEIKAING